MTKTEQEAAREPCVVICEEDRLPSAEIQVLTVQLV